MIAPPKEDSARPLSDVHPPTAPVPPPARHVFISSPEVQTQPPKRTTTGRIPILLIVGLVCALSPFLKRSIDQAVNRPPPELTPQDCVQSIFKFNGINLFSTQRQRVLDRIASMNCDELNLMMLSARQNQEKFKTLTPQETQNANEVGEAFKLRLSVAGCQVTADGSYVEPSTGGVGK